MNWHKLHLVAAAWLADGRSIWSVGKPQGSVDVIEELPSPEDFWRRYIQDEGGDFDGYGKPVLLKNAARRMPAFHKWSDEYLMAKYGNTVLDQVETEKKETRTKFPHEDWTFRKFLSRYNKSVLYSTATTPQTLAHEVYLLPVMNCGGYSKKLAATVMWMSSGSTKSVIHQDGQDNIHCQFAGQKDWILWESSAPLKKRSMGWVLAEEEAKKDPAFQDAYGQYAGKVDVDNVDLDSFPGWDSLRWWNMTMRAGDCAFIPRQWFHFVQSPPVRSISIHVWFHGEKFDPRGCQALKVKGFDTSEFLFRIADCEFGYEEGKKGSGTKCILTRRKDASEL